MMDGKLNFNKTTLIIYFCTLKPLHGGLMANGLCTKKHLTIKRCAERPSHYFITFGCPLKTLQACLWAL